MSSKTLALTLAIGAAMGGCTRRSGPSTAVLAVPPRESVADSSWLARERVICGEVRGRVLDARTGLPLVQAYVTIDSVSDGVSTDSLGFFRVPVTTFEPGVPGRMRPVVVRVRYLGTYELKFYLPSNFGYVVEATLAPTELHVDHISTLRIKDPGFCARAT